MVLVILGRNKLENYQISVMNSKHFLAITNELMRYVNTHNINAMVMGISGGIDSAVTAEIAHYVSKHTKAKVVGVSMPIESNTKEEIERARLVGKAFCNEFHEHDLTEVFRALAPAILEFPYESDYQQKILMGNIKARIRMIQLYHIAGSLKGMVLSTDNFTELLLGFWTLHGDVGDFGPIQNLWKTEVYDMARYRASVLGKDQELALQECIKAVPTDGLGITSSDLDQFGEVDTYQEADEILYEYLTQGPDKWLVSGKIPGVIQMHIKTHFKRNNPVNIPRDIIFSLE